MTGIVYATFGRRLWAFMLALVIDLIVLAVLAGVGVGDYLAELMLVWVVLHHAGLVTEGGNFGHRLAGLRVVRAEDGERVGVLHAIIRMIVQVAAILPLGLGMLWMLDEPRRRTWGDLAAGSVVVREIQRGAVTAPAWAQAPPWWKPEPTVEPGPSS